MEYIVCIMVGVGVGMYIGMYIGWAAAQKAKNDKRLREIWDRHYNQIVSEEQSRARRT